ncbi:acetyltransferase [Sporolactobacillus shoreicorticis]|uniref:Acyltransferase family protein n=1 Tax=Sporolactobacillus shoreicorticis TaxID=1923877 RepID=A0ABW5S8L3_9BACL|nr:acyltransferase family protein [Sporolactobacillus shoreicorticis]MCO7126037.1 acetyltransferase [Sporolactobacillus shoreicorticis]
MLDINSRYSPRHAETLTSQSYYERRLKRQYMPGLDGLRALAIIGVVFYHLGIPMFGGGLLGVSLFFVLSGYLITDLLNFEWASKGKIDLKTFWLHRIRRLLPALITTVSILFLWVGFFNPRLFVTFKGDALAALFYVCNWWYVFHQQSYFASYAHPSLLLHFWSLAVEEQFYLIWPIVLIFCLRRNNSRQRMLLMTLIGASISALLMALLYHPGSDPSRVYYGTDTRAFSILIGASLAFIWPSWRLSGNLPKRAKWVLDTLGIGSIIVMIVMMTHVQDYDDFLYRGGLLLFSIFSGVSIGTITSPATKLGRLFSWGPLRWIGERSYAIYLWHYPIIMLVMNNLAPMFLQILLRVVSLILILIIANSSYKYIENPIRHGAIGREWKRIKCSSIWIRKRRIIVGIFAFSLLLMLTFLSAFTHWANLRTVQSEPPIYHSRSLSGAHTPSLSGKREKGHPAKSDNQSVAFSPRASKISQPVVAIGDSVLIDLKPYISASMPHVTIDGKIGRHMTDALPIVQHLKREGKLSHVVIIELGTNGPFSMQDIQRVIRKVGHNHLIILVNTRVPRSWQFSVNQSLAQIAFHYSNVKLADWYTLSADHWDYFTPDQVHLTSNGARAMTNLLIKTLSHS